MKNTIKIATFFFLSLFIASCTKDNDIVESFEKNANETRFKELEIGHDFTLSQSNDDVHIDFDYEGKSKITKITFDVKPVEIAKVNKGEVKWELKSHVVPDKYYKGKLNAHVHYHFHLEDANEKKITPAVGTYHFRITVEHEDKSKSYITKKIKIAKGDGFDKNIHTEHFTGLEIGSAQFIIPQSGSDAHIDFEYKGESKITKIIFDVMPEHVHKIGTNEFKWELKNYVVPEKIYKGKLNATIHYHVKYKEIEKNPKARPAEGEYKFRIIVEHEDGTKSAITKEVKVVRKFKDMEVGKKNVVAFGSDEAHVEYQYMTGNSTIAKILHRIWFKEWRTGQKNSKGEEIKIGNWNRIDVTVPEKEFKGKKDPIIHTHIELIKGMPKAEYYFTTYVTETGQTKPIKISKKFEIK